MRTFTTLLATILLLPASAAAKSGIVLSPSPDGITAGHDWQVKLVAIRNDGPADPPAGSRPGVRIKRQAGGESHSFGGRRQADGSWLVDVVFPSPGTWTYDVTGMGALGTHQHWDPVTIKGSATSASGFPLGWIAAMSPIAIALGLWFDRRRRSSQPR